MKKLSNLLKTKQSLSDETLYSRLFDTKNSAYLPQ